MRTTPCVVCCHLCVLILNTYLCACTSIKHLWMYCSVLFSFILFLEDWDSGRDERDTYFSLYKLYLFIPFAITFYKFLSYIMCMCVGG